MTSELVQSDATRLAGRIRSGEVSAREVLEAHLDQIERVNPVVNAIVTLVADRAWEQAGAADEAFARGEPLGLLHGLPIAHKDLVETAGIRTTYGSPLFAEHVPAVDALIVSRLRAAGAITVGKTNTPELGAGSHTFNAVFGATRNPWDLDRTCGGSSGGAAVALACRMLPIADGSDMGGSLRNPASFNNVVGLRPSPGRVPAVPSRTSWSPLAVQGPMARTVADVALMLEAIAGPDPRAPLSLPVVHEGFAGGLEGDLAGVRVGWAPRLGGLPVDSATLAVTEAQRQVFEDLGAVVVDVEPDLAAADEVFDVFRSWQFELGYSALYRRAPDQLKDTVRWQIEQGRALTGPDLGRAERLRTDLCVRFAELMEPYDCLVGVVSQVPPFPLLDEWVTEIDGVAMGSYIEWMRSCSRITVTGRPALSVPAGFTDGGLPVGVQIVGRHLDEARLLRIGHAFEQANMVGAQLPPLVG